VSPGDAGSIAAELQSCVFEDILANPKAAAKLAAGLNQPATPPTSADNPLNETPDPES
jgi:hypothetical protein